MSNLLHLQFTSGAQNYTGVNICATPDYLPRVYNASACGALVFCCFDDNRISSEYVPRMKVLIFADYVLQASSLAV